MARTRSNKRKLKEIQYSNPDNKILPAPDLEANNQQSVLKKRRTDSEEVIRLETIPEEIMLMIFSYLLSKPKDLAQLSLVSKLWYSLASDNQLWAELSIKNGYGDPKKILLDYLAREKNITIELPVK